MTSELFDNRYRFIKDLGEGGCGKVFLAREDNTDLIVAIKQLKDEDKERQEAIIYEMQMIPSKYPILALPTHREVRCIMRLPKC